ncbi:MAG: LysM peptidoglycan-binding domain-containing protein [Spirochaetales bacterium]|nr:LysM peptidoglycan-binding domain-containing protein [Spirochaetales bacterium]
MKFKSICLIFIISFQVSFSQETILSQEYLEMEIVQKAIKQYSCRASLNTIMKSFKSGSDYIYFMKKKIKDMGMPEDLLYLSLVESSFNIEATSRSGARGLWQFMLNSIEPHNIFFDQWVDERLDFWKSTEGAMEKLAYNYKVTGDWLLAIAAYNCGLGKIVRTIEEHKENDFFKLIEIGAIPDQTAVYVPKFLAFSYICQNAKQFPDFRVSFPRIEWERIELDHSIDIRLLAQKADLSVDYIKIGNKELKGYITPPSRDNYYLKVQKRDRKIIQKIINKHSSELYKKKEYIVQSGDTLFSIAKKEGITVEILLKTNKNIDYKKISPGDILFIPIFADKEEETNSEENKYVIKEGDTLWSIAQKFNVTIEEIMNQNNLTVDDILIIGAVIEIPRKR